MLLAIFRLVTYLSVYIELARSLGDDSDSWPHVSRPYQLDRSSYQDRVRNPFIRHRVDVWGTALLISFTRALLTSRQFVVASLVYYGASYLFPARDTYVDGLISADDVMSIDKQCEKDRKSPTETMQSEDKKSINVETTEVQV